MMLLLLTSFIMCALVCGGAGLRPTQDAQYSVEQVDNDTIMWKGTALLFLISGILNILAMICVTR